MSYVVGFTSNYPQKMHHRGSSVISYRVNNTPISCGSSWAWMDKTTPNPNIHYGALIGGPMNGVSGAL